MEKCPECNELAVEKDQHYCQDQLVCKACGAVISEISYSHDSSYIPTDGYTSVGKKHGNTLPWKIQKEGWKAIPPGEKTSLKKLDILALAFSVPTYMKLEASGLLKKALHHPSFVNLHMEKKKALAASCIYVIFRQNNWPITIATLCDLVQVELKTFNRVFKLILIEFNISLNTTPIEDLISVYLKDSSSEEKDDLMAKSVKIIELAREVWIVRGVKPNGVISAAVYIAWMSQKIDQRSKVPYKQFCIRNKIGIEPSASLRVKELLSMFASLAEKLPWIQKQDFSKNEILYSLDNILKYSKTLLATDNNDEDPDQFLCTKRRKIMKESEEVTPCNLKVSESPDLTEDDIPSSEMHKYVRSAEEIKRLVATSYNTEV